MPTLVVDNFSGKLTREIHGDINSGMIPFAMTFGGVYPFGNNSYPSQLYFTEVPYTASGGVSDPVLHFWNITNPSNGTMAGTIGLGLNANLWFVGLGNLINGADGDSVGHFINTPSGTATCIYGGGLYVGDLNSSATASTAVAYLGHDFGVQKSSDLGILTATFSEIGNSWKTNLPRPIEGFLGNLYVGNGSNIAEIISGNTVSTYTKLSPALPSTYVVKDLKVSNDGQYLVILASFCNDPTNALKIPGTTGSLGFQANFAALDSVVLLWNGRDATYNSIQFFKGTNLTSIVTSNTETMLFGKDDEGVGLWDLGGNKIYSIPFVNNLSASYPPLPGSSYAIGRKIFFLMQYGSTNYLFCLNRDDNSLYCLYYNSFAVESVKGGVTIPSTQATNRTGTDLARSKIYFSMSKIPISTSTNNDVYIQHLLNYGGTTFTGSYATQVQKLFKKVRLDEVRVFSNTFSGTTWTLGLKGLNASTLTGTSTFTYTFASGTDKTLGQGNLDCVKFKPQVQETSALGLTITNVTGNPGIAKIEVDYTEIPEPKTFK